MIRARSFRLLFRGALGFIKGRKSFLKDFSLLRFLLVPTPAGLKYLR